MADPAWGSSDRVVPVENLPSDPVLGGRAAGAPLVHRKMPRIGTAGDQRIEAGSPNLAMCSGPMNVVTSVIRSPRRVSTLIDQPRCAPASSFQR